MIPPAKFGTRIFVLLAAVLACTGCGVVANPNGPAPGDTDAQEALWVYAAQDARVEALRRDVAGLAPNVNPAEAERLAGAAVRYSEVLADEYHLSRPVELNNILIHLGIRLRGLCYELADDLYVRLRDLNLRTLDLYRGTADKGDLWHEHNCVVVTARGKPFETGIVLDAWRYAGKLRWIKVAEDHHPWQVRPVAGSTQPAGAGVPVATTRPSATTKPSAR